MFERHYLEKQIPNIKNKNENIQNYQRPIMTYTTKTKADANKTQNLPENIKRGTEDRTRNEERKKELNQDTDSQTKKGQ